MVRGVDRILKDDFGLTRGLADATKQRVKLKAPQKGPKTKQEVLMHRVQIFDPAVGTRTFLNEVIKFVEKTFESQPGRWPTYVANDLVPRLQGFERSEDHTSELQSRGHLVCRLLLEKKN